MRAKASSVLFVFVVVSFGFLALVWCLLFEPDFMHPRHHYTYSYSFSEEYEAPQKFNRTTFDDFEGKELTELTNKVGLPSESWYSSISYSEDFVEKTGELRFDNVVVQTEVRSDPFNPDKSKEIIVGTDSETMFNYWIESKENESEGW